MVRRPFLHVVCGWRCRFRWFRRVRPCCCHPHHQAFFPRSACHPHHHALFSRSAARRTGGRGAANVTDLSKVPTGLRNTGEWLKGRQDGRTLRISERDTAQRLGVPCVQQRDFIVPNNYALYQHHVQPNRTLVHTERQKRSAMSLPVGRRSESASAPPPLLMPLWPWPPPAPRPSTSWSALGRRSPSPTTVVPSLLRGSFLFAAGETSRSEKARDGYTQVRACYVLLL